jgi:hypothetical protein
MSKAVYGNQQISRFVRSNLGMPLSIGIGK